MTQYQSTMHGSSSTSYTFPNAPLSSPPFSSPHHHLFESHARPHSPSHPSAHFKLVLSTGTDIKVPPSLLRRLSSSSMSTHPGLGRRRSSSGSTSSISSSSSASPQTPPSPYFTSTLQDFSQTQPRRTPRATRLSSRSAAFEEGFGSSSKSNAEEKEKWAISIASVDEEDEEEEEEGDFGYGGEEKVGRGRLFGAAVTPGKLVNIRERVSVKSAPASIPIPTRPAPIRRDTPTFLPTITPASTSSTSSHHGVTPSTSSPPSSKSVLARSRTNFPSLSLRQAFALSLSPIDHSPIVRFPSRGYERRLEGVDGREEDEGSFPVTGRSSGMDINATDRIGLETSHVIPPIDTPSDLESTPASSSTTSLSVPPLTPSPSTSSESSFFSYAMSYTGDSMDSTPSTPDEKPLHLAEFSADSKGCGVEARDRGRRFVSVIQEGKVWIQL